MTKLGKGWLVAALLGVTLPGVTWGQGQPLATPQAEAPPAGEGPATAPPGEGRGPRHGPPPFDDVLERNAERLGLDDKTRTAIRALADGAREEGRDAEERLHALHGEMRTLLDQPAPDLEAVLRQADRIGAAETELHKLRLRTMLKIRALLTPEQRAELVRIHEERRRERGRGWSGPPPGAPPPGPSPDAF